MGLVTLFPLQKEKTALAKSLTSDHTPKKQPEISAVSSQARSLEGTAKSLTVHFYLEQGFPAPIPHLSAPHSLLPGEK